MSSKYLVYKARDVWSWEEVDNNWPTFRTVKGVFTKQEINVGNNTWVWYFLHRDTKPTSNVIEDVIRILNQTKEAQDKLLQETKGFLSLSGDFLNHNDAVPFDPDTELGQHKDEGKTRFNLIPPRFINDLAEHMTANLEKYPERNWEAGIAYSKLYDSVMRHEIAWIRGETNTQDTNRSHLISAICNLMFLYEYEQRGMVEFDDREKINGIPVSKEK